MSKSKAQKLAELHEEALIRFNACQTALREERMDCLKDRRFYQKKGAQWEGDLGLQFENKPKLEFNSLRKAINDICDDMRSNRMDVVFTSKDGASDDGLAESCAALYRSDVQDSVANEAFYNGFKEAVGGGFGAFRLKTRYEDPDVDEDEDDEDEPQRIAFEIIVDADSSVFFDLDAKRQDKSDAQFCFVVSAVTYAEYISRYDDDPTSWPKSIHQSEYDWWTPHVVYVAEYFVKEKEKYTLHIYRGLNDEEVSKTDKDLEDDEDLARTLEATGFREVKQKKRQKTIIKKYLMSGNGMLGDPEIIAGCEIPVVPIYGQRSYFDNVERCCGHVRDVADGQRALNMLMSQLAEIAAYSPVEVPVLIPAQVVGHKERWANSNLKPVPYHLVNPVIDPATGQMIPQGALNYTKVPSIPQASAALIQMVVEYMKNTLRSGTDTEKIKSHVSGTAIDATQQIIDRKSSEYIDNMAVAICRGGHIWLSMGKVVYHQTGRKMKALGKRKELSQLELKKSKTDDSGRLILENDLSRASFDVAVDVGPSSQSRRDATIRTMLKLLQVVQDPALQPIISLVIMMNMEGEGDESLRKYAREELVKRGIEPATPEEAAKMAQALQSAKPSPNDQYLADAAAAERAKAAKDQADTLLIAARVDETKASTLETLAGIEAGKQRDALEELKTLSDVKLAHVGSARDTAESLHGILNAPPPGSPGGTDGSVQ